MKTRKDGPKAKKPVAKKPPKTSPAKPKAKAAARASSSGLSPGDTAPAFRLLDDHGRETSLKEFSGQWLILYFYPKDMTPGCTVESCDFRDHLSRLRTAKAAVLGISKDSVATHAKFKAKEGLNFPLLSDESGEICEAYGVWKEKSLYGRKFMGIERTTFLIDPDGKIARVYSKVKVSGHVSQVLADLKLEKAR